MASSRRTIGDVRRTEPVRSGLFRSEREATGFVQAPVEPGIEMEG